MTYGDLVENSFNSAMLGTNREKYEEVEEIEEDEDYEEFEEDEEE